MFSSTMSELETIAPPPALPEPRPLMSERFRNVVGDVSP